MKRGIVAALVVAALVVAALALGPPASADHDPSAPVVSYTLTGTAGSNGWFRSDVTIHWSVVDPQGVTSSTCVIAELDATEGTETHSCTATSHGGTATGQVTLKIDKTLPTAPVGTPVRSPDANGWYNRPVAIAFSAGDAVSGIAGCTGSVYDGPDSATAAASGSCTDLAGNTRPGSFALQYDESAPSATAAASRAADANGWYNRDLRITFAQAPGDVSGPGTCSPPADYAGPDAATVSRSGTCTDRAGNTSSPVSFTFKYDGTPPQAVGSASRAPDSNGWYNRPLTISFAQAPGDVSGAGSCTVAATYGGPDTDGVTRSGSCTDAAGNASAPASVTFKYDETAPTGVSGALARTPDANGWFNHAVALAVTGTDARSGIESCGSPVYAGPDSATASLAGGCTDRAGNTSAPVGATFKYDGTPPTASGAPTRAPDVNGWFNSPLVVAFTGSDALSGIASCGEQTYSGPDSAAASIAGGCVDKAGNVSPAGASTFRYDGTPPSVSAVASRPPDGNGWYTRPVGIVAVGSDPVSGVASCTAPTYSGPDTAGVGVGATCTDKAGNTSAPAVATVKYDTVAPSVSAAADRPPDGAGWYRRPLTIGFSASDGLSGVASCTAPVRYDGPDRAGATVAGTCSDAAGNSAGATHAFRYDATAPKLGRLTAEALKGIVRLGWERPSDAVAVELVRSPGVNGARRTVVYRGTGRSFADRTVRTGVRYRYQLTLRDDAGNAAGTAVTAMSRLPLHRPALGAVVRAPVVLAWERVAGARFYNVQLLRNGVKVLTAWPSGPRFRLPAAWRFAGERQTLAKGRYRWFVWPARGTRERPSFGKLLGSSTFRVR